jgi:hypothetical protein
MNKYRPAGQLLFLAGVASVVYSAHRDEKQKLANINIYVAVMS